MDSDFLSSEIILSPQALGAAIRRQRKASHLRIDDAAALCGVSVDLLSRLENGHGGVTTARLFRILDGLGLVLQVLDKTRAPRASADSRAGPN